jgi:hypothetical protein
MPHSAVLIVIIRMAVEMFLCVTNKQRNAALI